MLYTVFGVTDPARQGWKAQLLEHSWDLAGKGGVLTGLFFEMAPGASMAESGEVADTSRRETLGSAFLRALLEWSFGDRPEGTVLILGSDSVLLKPIRRVVPPGLPAGQSWLHSGIRHTPEGTPFGFPAALNFLEDCCTSTQRAVVPVRLPIIIHSSDLRRIGGRWVELCEIIEGHFAASKAGAAGRWMGDAINFAFAAACAEYGIQQRSISLELETASAADGSGDAELICYSQPIWALSGRQIFSVDRADPLRPVPQDENLEHKHCREFVRIYNSFVSANRRAEGRFQLHERPSWSKGVMEGRLCDDILLETPAEGGRLWLNSTGKEVWDLCNSGRTVRDVLVALKDRYGGAEADIATETLALLDDLRAAGFLTAHSSASDPQA
jgi:hypothetical protein